MKNLLSLSIYCFALNASTALADDVMPDQIEFRRQASTRLMFDAEQNIPLSSMRPTKIIDLDVMHPEMQAESSIAWNHTTRQNLRKLNKWRFEV